MKKATLFVVLIVLLGILTLQFDLNSFLGSLKQVPLGYLLILLALQCVTQLLLNYQWCRIGKAVGSPLGFVKMFYINAQGTLMESITPGVKVGGEVVRAVLLKKELDCSADKAVAIVALQKLFSLSAFFGLNLLALFHISQVVAMPGHLQGMIYLILLLLTGLMLAILFFPAKISAWLERLSPEHKWMKVGKGFLVELLVHTAKLKDSRLEWWKQFGLAAAIWFLFPVKLFILVYAFSFNGSFLFTAEVAFISYLMGMLPLTPGGLGSFEGTMTGLLLLMGLAVYDGAVITVVFRFITFWFVVLMSIAVVACWKIYQIRGVKDEANTTITQCAYSNQHDPGACGHLSG
ncbi:MAG: flippase-like domain-containing protein [Clostridia bacterium]|nr:flippase-like domain-containing protein [Clostridia bacterium]